MIWPICNILRSPASHSILRSLVRACGCAGQTSLPASTKLHALIITTGLSSSPFSFLTNSLLHLYSARGQVSSARHLFDAIPPQSKDAADWTALMGCLSRSTMPLDALRLFVRMRRDDRPRPDHVMLVCAFNVCAKLCDVGMGVQGHADMLKLGFSSSVKACNALMDMYVKNGSVSDARRVFYGMEDHTVVSWTVLLDGTIQWEGLGSGRAVFDRMPEKNLVAWTVMVVAYVGNGFTREAFRLLNEASFPSHLRLNQVAVCSILSACAQSGDVVMGMWLHSYAVKAMGRRGIDPMLGTALIDMYVKCGRLLRACRVFEWMPKRTLVVWNAMINGLAVHGNGKLALDMFNRMVVEAKPDSLTFTSLLNACSHSGLVDEGCKLFHGLKWKYGISPEVEHYACLVDLLGRAGRLEEAERVVRSMTVPPNEVVLGSMLGSCAAHGKLRLGESTLRELIKLDPHNTEYHLLLSNMYASEGFSAKAKALRQALRSKGIKKIPGISSIHIDGEFHLFCAGDKSHPRTREVYNMLDEMIQRLKLAGYVPLTSSQGEDSITEMEEKEQALFSHSEKLAVCFGLISTRAGKPLYIFKNLRICHDCHSALKIVSKIYEREVVVRDRSRFHKFKDGSCSCSDYW